MKLDFDSNEPSVDQAILIRNALTHWIAEQPDQPPRGGDVEFCYRPDGTLDSLVAKLDGEE